MMQQFHVNILCVRFIEEFTTSRAVRFSQSLEIHFISIDTVILNSNLNRLHKCQISEETFQYQTELFLLYYYKKLA